MYGGGGVIVGIMGTIVRFLTEAVSNIAMNYETLLLNIWYMCDQFLTICFVQEFLTIWVTCQIFYS